MAGTTHDFGFHEGKCCDAVLRWLESHTAAQRADMLFPERDHDTAPVELTCRLGSQLYALEHTGVEPFEGHVRLQAEAERDFGPVYAGVAGKLPPGDMFELHVPARAMQGLSARQRAAAQAGIVAWVIAKAPSIVRAPIGRYNAPIVPERPAGVPFDLSLHRHEKPAGFPRDFSISPLVQSSTSAAERDARIEQACAKKFRSSPIGRPAVRGPSSCWRTTTCSFQMLR